MTSTDDPAAQLGQVVGLLAGVCCLLVVLGGLAVWMVVSARRRRAERDAEGRP